MLSGMSQSRVLGIDFGSKRVGVALSDEEGRFAFPYAVVARSRSLESEVLEIIKKECVTCVVIGWSKDFSGNENPIMKQARDFARSLEMHTGLLVAFEDETFTTKEARRLPNKAQKTRKKHSSAPVDASAAALILSSYLDKHPGKE